MNDIARRPERDELMIVGLGASAGGIAALKQFFQSADPSSGAAYVAILQMSPRHESHLASVLQSATRMKVLRVEEQSELKPDCVYVISPNQSLSIADNHLVVSQINTIEERRAPVDVFFRTLAAAKGPAAVAVILSGTGANGSSGLKRVKEFGGCVFAQDPEQAEYTDMPKNAIATGHVDQVLPAEQIPARIAAYKSHLHEVVIPASPDGAVEGDEHAIRDILIQLRRHTGHDFSTYKRSTVVRRIERRMSIHEVEALSKYAWYLREHPEEIDALLGDLLISVTNFFRDKEAFEAIKKNVIPRLFENRSAGDTIRVWIAGCATGEEAYSIAMLLMEGGAESLNPFGVQLFATDIDREAIAHARQGLYTETATADISPERLIPFFTKEPDGYRVRKELRERILFAVHDLVKDPPFSRVDLVCCRNLLIYLNRSGQQRVLNTLHFALQPNGFLFTGSAESPDSAPEAFVAFDKENGIFQARALEAQQPLSFPRFPFSTEPINRNVLEPAAQRAAQRLFFADLHLKLLEEYAPPSVVINEDYEIVHMTERAANYMQLPGGEPTHNLLKVIVPALRLELRSALYQATQKRTFVEARAVKLNETRAVNLIVRPVFRTGDSARGFILVVFQETGAGDGAERVQLAEPIAGQLEDELMRVKGQLVSTMEQHEVQTEELRASNEELQAANEELLSASQEMEVSREELQSINEELTTVNQELKVKIDELSHANDDFQNLINSTDIGTIFLDPALKVKSFTPRAREVFHLIPTDRGRALSDITSKIEYERLFEDAERVLDYLQPVEHEVQTREGRWYLMRVLPYRTLEDRIDGVVMTFLDLTSRKESEEALHKSEERFRSIVSQAAAGVAETDLKGNFTLVNQKYCEIMGYSEAELLEMKLWDITYPEDLPRNIELFERLASDGTPFALETRYVRKDRSLVWVNNNVSVIRDARKKPHSALALVYDITERKRADAEMLGLKNELGTARARQRLDLVPTSGYLSAMTRLHDLSTRLFAASELQPLLEEVLEAAMQLQGADFGNIQLYKTGALEIVAQRGFDQEFLDHFSEVHEGQPSRGVSLQRRERVVIEDIQTDPLYAASHEIAARAGYRAVQSTPLFSRAGEALGVLSTAFRQRHKPSERELRLTDLYARVAAEMIDRKQAEQALRLSEDRYRRTAEELAATNEKLEQKVGERTHLAEQRSRQLRTLALELTQAEAKERRRIAQILHDTLQQLIIAAKYKLQAIGGKKKDFEPVFDLLDDGIYTARTLAAEIAPPALYKSNFVTALEWIADKAKQQHGLATEISSSRRQIALSDAQKVFLYEATRELLLNAAKHSRAKRVRLRWGTCSDCAILRVSDDGVGFSAMEQKADSGFGLFSIRERLKALGGGMVIRSRAKRGTQVALVLPLRHSRKRNSVRARKQ